MTDLRKASRNQRRAAKGYLDLERLKYPVDGIMCSCEVHGEEHDCDWIISATQLNDEINAYRSIVEKQGEVKE